jgi:hypothetical protein
MVRTSAERTQPITHFCVGGTTSRESLLSGALETAFPNLLICLHGKVLRFSRARQCETETLAPDIEAMTEDVPAWRLVPAIGELSVFTGGPLWT